MKQCTNCPGRNDHNTPDCPMRCDYVCRHYGVPACIGRKVVAYGKTGVIMADYGHYIGVMLDGDPKRRIGRYHPTHEMVYGEMAENLPKLPKETNYDRYQDEEYPDAFHEYLGINRPYREKRKKDGKWEYRMYRTRSGWHRSIDRDIEGEWSPTAPLAKASYKEALKRYQQAQKEVA